MVSTISNLIIICLYTFMVSSIQLNTNNFQMDVYLFDPWDETLTGTTTLGQSGPGSNDSERIFHISKPPELESHHQMQFSVKPRKYS